MICIRQKLRCEALESVKIKAYFATNTSQVFLEYRALAIYPYIFDSLKYKIMIVKKKRFLNFKYDFIILQNNNEVIQSKE